MCAGGTAAREVTNYLGSHMKKSNKRNWLNSGPRGLIIFVTIFVLGIALLSSLTEVSNNIVHLSATDFLEYIDKDKIESVVLSGQDAYGVLKQDKQKFQARVVQVDSPLLDKLRAHGIKGEVVSANTPFGYLSFGLSLLLPLIAIAILFALYRMFKGSGSNQSGGPGGIFGFSKSRARLFLPAMVKERFNDVAGAYEAKEDLQDIIDFLKGPERFLKMGAKVPRGILLIGEPGNGKTMLARAVAGEAGVPFFSITGSDFIEVFVGVGAARVRDLFEQARKQSPCIIFIDEIDAIGRHRGSGLGGGHDEREQTLNQLLTELDGFDAAQVPLVVMAATNIPEVLDKALLRPGRFDRQVMIPFPELPEREQVLRIHTRDKKLAPSVDLNKLAVDMAGFSCADVANVANLAAIAASKDGRTTIEQQDFIKSLDKARRGKESTQHAPSLVSKGSGQARMFMPSQVKFSFADIAGLPEAKEELSDIVNYLQNPAKYAKAGARVPHGVLLIGDPGNGKTLLAKAIAGQAKCPFFSTSGAEFIEQYVGIGAARVRELFSQAKKHAPCILFIDEIDSIGSRRHASDGGSAEHAQTLNQLLTEMDGFESSEQPVIVIGATNRVDMLDSALLRPGRFDRQVYVPYPSIEVREEILRVHARNKQLDPSVDLHNIARGTPGFSGASLANLINEAALQAVNADREVISMHDFEEARDKVMWGKAQRTIKQTKEELRETAYHEAGHALVRVLMPKDTDPLHKITILPRGRGLGLTHFLPEKDRYIENKDQLIAEIMAMFGGRVADELASHKLTSGASLDFKQATDVARKMVCMYAMSPELASIAYDPAQYESYSEKTREKIDQEVQKILDKAYADTKKMVTDNRDKLDALAALLLEKETLFADDVYALLGITPRQDHRWVAEKKNSDDETDAGKTTQTVPGQA